MPSRIKLKPKPEPLEAPGAQCRFRLRVVPPGELRSQSHSLHVADASARTRELVERQSRAAPKDWPHCGAVAQFSPEKQCSSTTPMITYYDNDICK